MENGVGPGDHQGGEIRPVRSRQAGMQGNILNATGN